MHKERFISAQVLRNKDGSMKAQRVYAIPMPAAVSLYLEGWEITTSGQHDAVTIGVMVQDWNSHEILDSHPNIDILIKTLEKSFGLIGVV